MSTVRWAACAGFVVLTGSAMAQTPPASPPASPSVPAQPNAVTPPGGVPRGVIPAPTVDPDMVAKPPPRQGSMPVIKPPGEAR